MNNISLTSSMRSNLQSLQGIAGKQNVVQNRLASGLKVSSAIDNASSYYTAMSLNNRSADLSTLLDSMSQGIQTIKTASESLATATKMLEQAKALATQTLDKTTPPVKTAITKGWLIENGVRAEDIVTTKAELTARMARVTAGDRIVVWGKIEMGDVELTMKDNVKLVGAEQVIREAGRDNEFMVDEFNRGKITFNKTTNANGIIVGNNTEISDLSLESVIYGKANGQGLIYNNNKILTLRNLDLKQIDNTDPALVIGIGAITNNGVSTTYLEGIINIETSGTGAYNYGIRNAGNNNKNIQSASAELNITTYGERGYGIHGGTNTLSGTVNINTSGDWGYGIYGGNNTLSGTVNINTSGDWGYGILNGINILSGTVNINTSGINGYGIYNGTNTLSGTVNITTSGNSGFSFVNGNHTFKSSAKILIESKTSENRIFYADANKASYSWERGAQIGLKNSTGTTNALWEAGSDGSVVDKTTPTTDLAAAPFNWTKVGTFPGIPAQTVIARNETIHLKQTRNLNAREIPKQVRDDKGGVRDDVLEDSLKYSALLAQFNNLIADSGYKGINLLLEQNLRINFNEDRSSNVNIKGVDASAKGLGLETTKWNDYLDIEKSISELDASISKLRGFSEEFGNYYSIVSTREDFTKSIINVLTEGADKLTLADMNQESANMLALQTRQQLAVNSLSLASQASQSVLKLF